MVLTYIFLFPVQPHTSGDLSRCVVAIINVFVVKISSYFFLTREITSHGNLIVSHV